MNLLQSGNNATCENVVQQTTAANHSSFQLIQDVKPRNHAKINYWCVAYQTCSQLTLFTICTISAQERNIPRTPCSCFHIWGTKCWSFHGPGSLHTNRYFSCYIINIGPLAKVISKKTFWFHEMRVSVSMSICVSMLGGEACIIQEPRNSNNKLIWLTVKGNRTDSPTPLSLHRGCTKKLDHDHDFDLDLGPWTLIMISPLLDHFCPCWTNFALVGPRWSSYRFSAAGQLQSSPQQR